MNSHKPSDVYLIPTTLTPQLPAGIQLVETIYPEGRSEKFLFSPDKPLNVYTGSVTLRLRLSADAKAALGATSLPVTLRYQACNDAACLPPVRVPVQVSLHIAASGAKSHLVHPEVIFDLASQQVISNRDKKAEGPFPEVLFTGRNRVQFSALKRQAQRRRATTRSLPSTTIVSNRGGATARPTIATRVALIRRPAFTPSVVARPRSAASHAS